MKTHTDWFHVNNIDSVDSPALLVYNERVQNNIATIVKSIDSLARLRPHVKTHKSTEVTRLMMQAGITKFKCATIAEAEMLATAQAPDVVLAYQPVGPKAGRLAELAKTFPETTFSCLIDNIESAKALAVTFSKINSSIRVYIDLNVGMNRTGIVPEKAGELFKHCLALAGVSVAGLHAYDGHLRDTDYNERKRKCDEIFARIETLASEIEARFQKTITIIAGGTPTYSIHSKRKEIECSPGTFIYWDKGYEQILPEQQYDFAAIILTRVISLPSENIICTDLGHKSIASENPLANRVSFLNAPDLEPIGHSEEHMVFKTNGSYKVGDVLYGVPYHICPTVALHDRVAVVENGAVAGYWSNDSRNRKITI
jgi:D-serine deaminase-like pyridoxal phosphate-dependent protein